VTALVSLGRRFARLATNAVVRWPWLWPLFRRPLERQFDWLAPHWDSRRAQDHLASFEAALERVETAPARALDVGTGTGAAAFALARRFPDCEIVGVDLSREMIEQAVRKTPQDLRQRVRFQVADSAALPFADGSFDLVALANMIPFFDELARVLQHGGYAVFGFSDGASTPIYVPPERLRAELGARGFAQFAEVEAGPGTGLLARKADSA
jgi:ubiquinone/menaquinone biosynthesis C-methylase UbiE